MIKEPVKRFARDIPLEKITIERLEKLFSTTVRVSLPTKTCMLRLNPHHMGYTYLNIGGYKYPAHRIVATVAVGRNIPDLVVDHLCRNRSCIRLSHLEFVTDSVNIQRGVAWLHFLKLKDKTHCDKGHSLDNALLSTRITGTIKRGCRTCHMLRERNRRKRARNAKEIN